MSKRRLNKSQSTIALAFAMLVHRRARLISSIVVLGLAFFLTQAQIGLLCSWIDTTTALITHGRADLWIMAPKTCALDYGTPIPRERIYQVRSVPGVNYAEGMIVDWSFWQCGDGARVSIEIVGLDKGLLSGPWLMQTGDVSNLFDPYHVIVDSLYMKELGVSSVGDEFDIVGHKAIVSGISRNVRTFTASPFVFSSLSDATEFDPRYTSDQITYVLAKCDEGANPDEVRNRVAAAVPFVEVLTAKQFFARTAYYWMLSTGAGITVVVTAVLGLLVGTLIANQTLFSITQDHLKDYATLMALGFSKKKLIAIVISQGLMLGVAGILVGSAFFYPAMLASMQTPIPVALPLWVFAGVAFISLFSCGAASWMSVSSIFRIDPVTVFSQ
jgi:putative ABC transport system permease protein